MPRQRKTTSVSTLVNDVTNLVDVARKEGNKTLVAEIAPLYKSVKTLESLYNDLRKSVDKYMTTEGSDDVFDIDAYVDSMLPAETVDKDS